MSTAREKTLLTEFQIEEALTEIDGWEYKGNRLERTFKTKNFTTGVEFINEIVPKAEAANHHPDVFLSYPKVKIQLMTHELHGISNLDIELAQEINEIALAQGIP